MKKLFLIPLMLTMFACPACETEDPAGNPDGPKDNPGPVDPNPPGPGPTDPKTYDMVDDNATQLTKNLYKNLFTITDKGTMFGHQIPTLYGMVFDAQGSRRWFAQEGNASDTDNSDAKYLTGSHPAVCGWELSNIEFGNRLRNIDNELFTDIRNHIIAAHARGAVQTISWHCANPANDKNSWDRTKVVNRIIPGGDLHSKFKGYMDNLAAFLVTLKTPAGDPIPIIFRPWHEHTGGSFWWAEESKGVTADEFAKLWKFTVEYLRDTKGLHNLIYCYSPDIITSRSHYLRFWPGDEWVDMLGLDAYDRTGWDYTFRGPQMVSTAVNIAKEKKKVFAITETGLENNNPAHPAMTGHYFANWWTGRFYKMFENKDVVFALVWRNGNFPPGGHYFSAFRGAYTEADFKAMALKTDVLFEDDLPDMFK